MILYLFIYYFVCIFFILDSAKAACNFNSVIKLTTIISSFNFDKKKSLKAKQFEISIKMATTWKQRISGLIFIPSFFVVFESLITFRAIKLHFWNTLYISVYVSSIVWILNNYANIYCSQLNWSKRKFINANVFFNFTKDINNILSAHWSSVKMHWRLAPSSLFH